MQFIYLIIIIKINYTLIFIFNIINWSIFYIFKINFVINREDNANQPAI